MQAVGILGRIDALEDPVRVDVLRQRQLHDVAVAHRIGVELVDQRFDLLLRGICGQFALDRVHPDRLGLLVLHSHVQLGCRIRADQHRRDARDDAPRAQRRDPLGQLGLDLRGCGLAVQDDSGHCCSSG